MQPRTLFVLTMAVSLSAGLAHMLGQSVVFVIVFITAPLWWPEVLGYSAPVLAYAGSLLISTATLLLAGIPAALLERLGRAAEPSTGPMLVWLAAAVLLSVAGLALGRV